MVVVLCAGIILLLIWCWYTQKHEDIKTFIQAYTVLTQNFIQEPRRPPQKPTKYVLFFVFFLLYTLPTVIVRGPD